MNEIYIFLLNMKIKHHIAHSFFFLSVMIINNILLTFIKICANKFYHVKPGVLGV